MLQNIPTHVIAGALGAGKTSLIRDMLAQRPANERWAVLINEFGQIGVDAALLSTADDGIALGEVAGGCLCCVNGAPFQVGLGRLLRKARPDRLLIEPSGLGHPVQLLRQLHEAPWAGVLDVQPLVMLLDAHALASGQSQPGSQREALAQAGLMVLNKADQVLADDHARIEALLPAKPRYWTEQGRLPLALLPTVAPSTVAAEFDRIPSGGTAPLTSLWSDPGQPICLSQQQPEGWSIGWRWHPKQRFDLHFLQGWLATLDWRRAKLVAHCTEGWLSANGLEGGTLAWKTSEWRRDSRFELIFTEPQDEQTLKASMLKCLVKA